jgi:hypothetical protein
MSSILPGAPPEYPGCAACVFFTADTPAVRNLSSLPFLLSPSSLYSSGILYKYLSLFSGTTALISEKNVRAFEVIDSVESLVITFSGALPPPLCHPPQ